LNINIYFLILLIGLAAIIGDFIVPFILGRKYPNHNVLYDVISELGTKESPVRKQISVWLIILGVLFICFGIGQGLQFRNQTWAHWIYLWGLVMFGIGAGVIAGIFPEDTRGTKETISGKIHGIFSGLGFMFLIMNPLWALWIDELNGLEGPNTLLFILGVITFGLFAASEKNEAGILGMSGLWQRLNMLVVYSAILINFIVTKPA